MGGLEEMEAFMGCPACSPFADRVHFIGLSEPYAGISSTQVRRRRSQGQPICDQVPDGVAAAIQAMGLYL